jgi:TonB family protein
MKKKAKPESFIRKPKYPGGKMAMDAFIKTNLKYPEEALRNKIEGIVSIKLDIDVFGNVIKTSLVHGIGYGCDEEALRIVKLLKYEKKMYRGLRVTHHNTLNIIFRLPENAHKPIEQMQQEMKIQYQITTVASPPANQPPQKEEQKYSYTIIPEQKE